MFKMTTFMTYIPTKMFLGAIDMSFGISTFSFMIAEMILFFIWVKLTGVELWTLSSPYLYKKTQ